MVGFHPYATVETRAVLIRFFTPLRRNLADQMPVDAKRDDVSEARIQNRRAEWARFTASRLTSLQPLTQRAFEKFLGAPWVRLVTFAPDARREPSTAALASKDAAARPRIPPDSSQNESGVRRQSLTGFLPVTQDDWRLSPSLSTMVRLRLSPTLWLSRGQKYNEETAQTYG